MFTGWGSHVIITHDDLDLIIQGPPAPATLPCAPYSDIWWPRRPVQTCSLEHLRGADHWWLTTEACSVEEQAVHILLECFSVLHITSRNG